MVNVSHSVTLIPGDGIGPEVADAAMRAVNATGVSIDWQRADLNASIIAKSGQVLPPHVIESLERTRVGLKGPVTTPIGGGFPSVNVALRKHFDLYANVRPVHSLPGLKTRFDDVLIDMVIFRENTEDLYSGPGARGGEGRGHQPQSNHAHGVHPDCRICLPVRQESRAQEGHRDS